MAFANFNPSKIINEFQTDTANVCDRDQPLFTFDTTLIHRLSSEHNDASSSHDYNNNKQRHMEDEQGDGLSLKVNVITHLQIHQTIVRRLDEFILKKQIPHIIFHGPSGAGKQTLVREFIQRIYGGDKLKMKTHVMTVNCSHGKGIQFIREELKFFAKSNAQTKSNVDGGKSVEFKVIMLLNAHHLTVDAQSALRRCIELFSYNTRFFIVVENKDKLLNPILSRFCDIFVPEPASSSSSSSSYQNLHQYVLSQQFQDMEDICREDTKNKMMELNNAFGSGSSHQNNTKTRIETVNRLYESGISCLDLMEWVKNQRDRWSKDEYYRAIMRFYQIKPQFRCEKLLILFMVNYLFQFTT